MTIVLNLEPLHCTKFSMRTSTKFSTGGIDSRGAKLQIIAGSGVTGTRYRVPWHTIVFNAGRLGSRVKKHETYLLL
eukprot:SAG11_NODE_15660_length_570_cov_1.176221_2_plen_75_part_01